MTEYEKQINALIPEAQKIADQRTYALPPDKRFEERPSSSASKYHETYNYCLWTQFFHEAMNQLAFDAGLRSWK